MNDKAVDAVVDAIGQRQMVMPALLFLVGHRPLAFVLGQTLLVLQPLAALLGANGPAIWGELLSQPTGPSTLTARLALLMEEDGHAVSGRKTDV